MAMTRITTGCPRCGRVELDVDDVVLVISPREDTSWYFFDCRGCAHRIVKPAPTTVAVALTAVRTTVWTVPAEVLERVGPGEAPPIAVDDLLDALLGLAGDADLAALAAGGSGARTGTGAPVRAPEPSSGSKGGEVPMPGEIPEPGGTSTSGDGTEPGEVTKPRWGGAGNPPARPSAA
jgi:hypothetical protein